MKRLVFLFFFLFIVVGCLGSYVWYSFQPVSSSTDPVSLVVAKNQSASSVIDSLVAKKLLRSAVVAKLYLRLSNQDSNIRPGAYVLTPSQNLPSIFALLSAGPADVWITIPEGWRREQISDRFTAAFTNFNSQEFLSSTRSLEGQLFPDTYLIPVDASASDVIRILTANFVAKSQLTLPGDYDQLIIASLVEREAKHQVDRPIIAGIITKRLKADWPLQIDATVQYAAGSWAPLTSTRLPSPYNTYLRPGLPPGPICNPGLASIEAARNPSATPYWYYLTGTDGQMYYATTLDQHNLNIDKYLRH